MNQCTDDIMTIDEFLLRDRPYDLDFSEAISRLDRPRIESENDVNAIWEAGGSLPDRWNWNQYCPTNSEKLMIYIIDLLNQTDKNTNNKFCDLGIGTSFVQSVFAALGFKTYGVDLSDKALRYSRPYHEKVQRRLGFEYRHQPLNVKCNIHSEEFPSLEFPDGTSINAMDILFCNISDDRNTQLAVMRSLKDIRSLCIWMGYYYRLTRSHKKQPSIFDTHFRPINQDHLYSLLFC